MSVSVIVNSRRVILCILEQLSFYKIFMRKVPPLTFHFVLIVAPCVDRGGTASRQKDLVQCEQLFWKIVKDTRHLFAQKQFGNKRKILK